MAILNSRSCSFITYKSLFIDLSINGVEPVKKILTILVSIGTHIFFITYIYICISSKFKYKWLMLVFFSIALIVEYGCTNIMKRFTKSIDILAAFSTPTEQKIDFLMNYLNFNAFLPIIILIVVNYSMKKTKKKNSLIFFFPFFFVSLFFFYTLTIQKDSIFIPHKLFFPINSLANFCKTTMDYIVIEAYNKTINRDNISFPPSLNSYLRSKKKNKNIIFIVDESLRSDHMSIYNYKKKTTPFLEKIISQDNVSRFESCVSGTTASRGSSQLLLTGLRINDLPDISHKLQKLPTIYQYAKLLGYKTFFLDGQTNIKWLGNRKDYEYIDIWKNKNYFMNKVEKKHDIDISIAEELNDIISTSTGNFIWVWKRGVHFPYSGNYPYTKKHFSLDNKTPKERLIASYDNGIRHNVDNFFKVLYPVIECSNNTVIVYTSDHGESLLDDGETRLHAGTRKEQAQVPLLMLGDIPENLRPDIKVAHENIFATLLDLLEYPKNYRQYDYANSLIGQDTLFPLQRFYWQNDLTTGKPILFDTN